MLKWGHPVYLIGLLIPLAILLSELWLRSLRRAARTRFAADHLWQTLSPGRSDTVRAWRRWLLAIAIVFIVIGLANPMIGTRYEEVTRRGVDIFMLVDVSKSMDTQDIRPSRLGKTRYELNQFLRGLKGDRVGLIPFSGTAYPLCPLTMDYAAAGMFVDLLATNLIPVGGTAVSEAIQSALAAFPESESGDRSQAILLVSDGEDHEGGAVDLAREAGKKGIPIFTIGMALAKGDPIPEINDQGQQSGWKTDENGQVVTSRLNEDLLRQIAEASGGAYYRAGQGGDAFKAAYDKIFGLDRKDLTSKRITGHESRYQVFLAIGLMMLLIEFLIPAKRTRRDGWKRLIPWTTALVFLLSGGLLQPVHAQKAHRLVKKGNQEVEKGKYDEALTRYLEARSTADSSRPELFYDLGGVFARKGEVGKADTLYRILPEDTPRDLRAKAEYNRGTAFANAKQYDQAVQSLINSLKMNPGDEDARTNLELARRFLQQQQQQQQQNQDSNQNDKDQKQKQDQQQNQDQQQKQDQQNQQKQDQKEDQQKQDQSKPMDEQQMEKELAKRFLDQLQQDEKEQLRQVVRQQIPVDNKKVKKDW